MKYKYLSCKPIIRISLFHHTDIYLVLKVLKVIALFIPSSLPKPQTTRKSTIMDVTIDRQAQEIERWYQSNIGPCAHKTHPGGWVKDQIMALWKNAPNWHTMIELNRRYLQRRLPVCAGYGMPPDDETDRFTNLLRLHDYGIISTNSCPGFEIQLGNSPVFARQRAYLFFSIPSRILFANAPKALFNFVKKLRDCKELFAFIRFKYNNAPNGAQRDQEINGLMGYGYCCSFPDSGNKEWKREKWGLGTDKDENVISILVPQEQRRQNSQTWKYHGSSDVYLSGSDFHDDINPFPASHATDPLHIAVFARDWNFTEIGQLIERLLIESGIMPGFVARG